MKRYVFLICLFALASLSYGTNSRVLEGLTNPSSLNVCEKYIYVIQDINFSIYSHSNFKFLKQVGKLGEGPQEYLRPFGNFPISIELLPDQLFVISAFKLSHYSLDGTFKKEQKTSPNILSNRSISKLGNNYIGSTLSLGTVKEKNRIMITYNIYDSNFNIIKELYRVEQGYEGPEVNNPFNPLYWTVFGPCNYVADQKIFIGHYGQHENGAIHVFGADGKKLYDITPEYDKIKFTQKDKEAYIKTYITSEDKQFYNTNKHLFRYDEYLPFRQSFVISNNKIYIQTYRKNEKGDQTQFIILDLQGKMLKKIMVPFAFENSFTPYKYTIFNDKIYQLTETEDEEWQLIINDIK